MKFRIIPQLDKNPKVIAFAQTALGRATLFGLFSLGFFWLNPKLWFFISLAGLAIVFIRTADRIKLTSIVFLCLTIFGGTEYSMYTQPGYFRSMQSGLMNKWAVYSFSQLFSDLSRDWYQDILTLSLILFSFLVFFAFTKGPSLVKRKPLLCLFVLNGGMIFAMTEFSTAMSVPVRTVSWAFLAMFNSKYIWILGYNLLFSRQIVGQSPLWLVPTTLWTGTPVGKCLAFLKRYEPKNEAELARSQIKALKLLAWVILNGALLRILNPLISLRGYQFSDAYVRPFGATNIFDLYITFIKGGTVSVGEMWVALIFTFFYDVIYWLIAGNFAVALIRFCGFSIPRAMYKPLYAKSIAEFFNRRFYYYKELIFDFFFFPLFQRLGFVKNVKLRKFLAVFVAVTGGTYLSHLMIEITYLAHEDLGAYLYRYLPMLFRCVVFGLLIGMYQLGNPLPVAGTKWKKTMHALNFIVIVLVFSFGKLFTPMMQTGDPMHNFRFFAKFFDF